MHPGSQGPRRGNDPAARAGETTDQINHGTFGPITYPGYPATVRPGRQYADFLVIKNSGTYSTRWLRATRNVPSAAPADLRRGALHDHDLARQPAHAARRAPRL